MIRRIKAWFGMRTGEHDELLEALRHRAAHLTMNVTVVGCLITAAVIRVSFPEEHALLTMALIVALFIMMTSSLISGYYGVQQAEDELSQRRPLVSKYIIRRVIGLFLVVFLIQCIRDVLIHRIEPKTLDLFGNSFVALIWTGVMWFALSNKNKRRARSS